METLTEHRMSERVSSHRRANKPLVEKQRRARINDSLSQLKSLLLQAMKEESAQFSRLEKADILEMTVKYLRHMQKQQVTSSMSSDPCVAGKYRAGFNECASEVLKYLQTAGAVKDQVKCSLGDHLAKCLTVVNHDIFPYPDRQNAIYSEMQATLPARACSVSPVDSESERRLPPLVIQIPEATSPMTSSPGKQTTPTSLLLMPLAQSTPVRPISMTLVRDHSVSCSARGSSPDSDVVANNFNNFKNITNIRVHPYHQEKDAVQQTTSYPHYPVYPAARMPTTAQMLDSGSPVHPSSPQQPTLHEDRVWRPW